MPVIPSPSRALVATVAGAALACGALTVAAAPADATSVRTATAAAAAHAAAATQFPTVRPGMTHRSVKKLQRLLHVHPRSGWYGPRTKAAVKKWKAAHGYRPTATFGQRAWRTLLAEKAAADRSRPASRSTSRSGFVCPAPKARFGNDYGDSRGDHSHTGIDMLGKRGMPLYAIENGYVVRAGKQSDGANRIVIQGTQTGAKYYYGHNSKHLVSNGQRFKAGDVIALMGDSGSPGINHLHFEWWKSGGESDPVNPYQMLRDIC